MQMTKRDLEIVNIIRASSLTINGRTVFSREFPMGEGWYRFMARINIVVTIGTGSGAIAESELLFIKNLLLRTDRGEILCNLPGRAIYKIAATKSGAPPRKDAMAAASATYSVDLPIWFVDHKTVRPEDTILDTARYQSITLDVQVGGVADLFTTVGTSSVTATLDVDVERSKGLLPPEAQPVLHISYDYAQPVDAASATTIELERSPDLAYKRLYAHECSDGSAGVPFSGANADDVKNLESIRDQTNFIVQERIHEMIQNQNKNDFSLETALAGITVTDFVADGSLISALMTGDKSRLQYIWTNKAGVAANDIVTVAFEGIRKLK
jgi:hypothetical protein